MSTYSPNLRIQLIATGDQVGTWGTTTNTNLGTLLEDAISGYTSVSVTTANQALTANNGSADQSRNVSLALTTTTTAAFAVYAPPAEKTYVIYNASSYTATIYNSTVLGNTTAAGAGVAIPAGKTVTVWSDGTDFRFQNNHLSSLTLATDLAVADGGTGASTAADARTNLGLGTIATQNSSSVSITGGSITGITDLAVADGGTGASTAANARTNLGVAIGSDVQAYNAGLADIAGLAKTDGNLIVGNGTNWVAESGSTARTSLGLGTIATQNSNSVTITGGSITGITDLAVADGGTGASTAADARTNLGLGTIATQAASSVSITGGSISGITDLAVADGGTGASTAADARTNLGLGTIATQAASSVSITGGSITGITDLAVADGGTGASSFTSGSLIKGNGTSALSVASAADIVAAIGSTAVANATNATTAANGGVTSVNSVTGAINIRVGAGTVASGATFTAVTGASGKCLIQLHTHVTAGFGDFGTRTVGISIGGTVVASGTLSTMEYDSRVSGDGRTISYVYTGSADANVTITYSVTGSGGTVNAAFYSYMGV